MFTALGSYGTNNSYVNGSTLSINPSAAIPIGTLIVVWVAWDNNNGASTLGPLTLQDHVNVSDSVGNIYFTLAAGAAGGGVNTRTYGGVYIAYARKPLATTDTITTRCYVTKVAKAMSVECFAIEPGYMWSTADRVQTTDQGTDPKALSLAGLPSDEYLMLHVLSAEGPNTDTYTWDADYTRIVTAGTNSGAADTNQTINGGYRIATLTGDTVDVTALTAFRDYTQELVAIAAAPIPDPFPSTALLDSFDRADVDPLPTPPWENTACAAHGTNNMLANASNLAKVTDAVATNAGQFWGTTFAAGDQEAWMTLSTPGVGNGNGAEVQVCASGCGTPAVATLVGVAYGMFDQNRNSPHTNIILGRSNITSTLLRALGWYDPVAGDKIGVRQYGSHAMCFVDIGVGWECIGASYQPPNPGGTKIGLNIRGTGTRCNDFGGGGFTRRRLLPYLHVGQ